MQIKDVRKLTVGNFVMYTIAFLISALSQSGIIKNQNMGDVSDKYDALFTPAGITFSIWGVIYVALFAFCIYHLVKSFKSGTDDEANQHIQKLGKLFIINNLSISIWVFAFLNEYLLISVILIVIQLSTLALAHIRLNIYNTQSGLKSKIFTFFPLTIYFAWICIATIANISAWLVSINFEGFGLTNISWTIVMISTAILLSVFIIINRKNYWFSLVIIWALYGIILKRNEAGADEFSGIVLTAWIGVAMVAMAAIYQVYQNKSKGKHA